jgi:MFS-type transporter involved in bile tolerance (Atg22 family)
MTTPLILLTPAIALAMGFAEVREEFGRVFGLAALSSAVVSPAMGAVVALVGRRRRACRRFAIMGAVSSVPVLFFWIFGVLLAECPDGYHC